MDRRCSVALGIAAIASFAIAVAAYAARPMQSADPPVAPWDHVENVRLGGFDRHFIVHVPPTFDGKRKLPVVIMLHGAGGTGRQAMEQT
ncbi:MAG TPA: hypothetical protein VMT64_01065, partial [Candidatus Binataceae bacterium]|nr:hypothetical protein [Candidatus Binataceae bacterium]